MCATHTRKAFPVMAKSVLEVATRVVKDLPSKLQGADEAIKKASDLCKVNNGDNFSYCVETLSIFKSITLK